MKRFQFLTIALLVIILIFNLYLSFIKKNQETPKKIETDNSQDFNLPRDFYYIKENYLISSKNSDLTLNNVRVYFGNDTIGSFNLFNSIKGKYLVFRFSGDACNTCVDFVVAELKRVFKDYAINDRIILAGSNINPRVKEGYYGKKILSFYETDFGLELEKYSVPFLFVIDKDQVSKMVFIPDKSFPDITENYLEIIKNRYFK